MLSGRWILALVSLLVWMGGGIGELSVPGSELRRGMIFSDIDIIYDYKGLTIMRVENTK